MDAELKTKWVKALRSGKYKQGRYNLKDRWGYCCLGVLAECLGADWASRDEPVLGGRSIRHATGSYLEEEACGIDIGTQQQLAQLNDDDRPFEEIADYIDARL